MLTAENETTVGVLQGHLDEAWKLVDGGEPKERVIGWLRKKGHRVISDWAATEVANLVERGRRSASAGGG